MSRARNESSALIHGLWDMQVFLNLHFWGLSLWPLSKMPWENFTSFAPETSIRLITTYIKQCIEEDFANGLLEGIEQGVETNGRLRTSGI